jgi:hypothetical protein
MAFGASSRGAGSKIDDALGPDPVEDALELDVAARPPTGIVNASTLSIN